MGRGYSLTCRACTCKEKAYLGVGFAFPKLYEGTKEAIEDGEYGPELKEIFLDNPDAAFDAEIVLLQCPDCGFIGTEKNLSVYLPKNGYDHEKRERHAWSSVMPCYDVDYVSPSELSNNYTLFKEFKHHCPICGREAEVITEDRMKDTQIICPQCRNQMIVDNNIMWD